MTYDSFKAVSWLSEFLLGAGVVPGTSLPSSCRPARLLVPSQAASPPGAVLNKQRNASPSQNNSLGRPSAAEVFFD